MAYKTNHWLIIFQDNGKSINLSKNCHKYVFEKSFSVVRLIFIKVMYEYIVITHKTQHRENNETNVYALAILDEL